ncbi:WG repeat-containing protein [Campylobacter sp. JMF_06 NA1]|uniref:WG repeat-containing protein n=1 Tax=Campylobacter sp. JMF_06 NA1 TaxID=2983823 RepID=UPI0022E9ABD1|nr:WG repeat-containing protein [Campylobacter sp. JMF_06 NA1]MDA3077781.1 WG repeat-containing protein [Campylobacter sp. JMF_06 NA1]
MWFDDNKKYNVVKKYRNGYSLVTLNGKYGVVDYSGSIKIPCIYDRIYQPEFEIIYEVIKDNKRGVVNEKGKEIIPCIYDKLYAMTSYTDDLDKKLKEELKKELDEKLEKWFIPYEVVKDYKHGVICLIEIEKGSYYITKEIIPCIYDDITTIRLSLRCNEQYCKEDEYFKVIKNEKYGLMDKYGKEIIPCAMLDYYDVIDIFDDKIYKVKKNDKYVLIDKTGKEIISCDWRDCWIYKFSDEYYIINKGYNKYGLIDATLFNEIIPCIYEIELGDKNLSFWHQNIDDGENKILLFDFDKNKTPAVSLDIFNDDNCAILKIIGARKAIIAKNGNFTMVEGHIEKFGFFYIARYYHIREHKTKSRDWTSETIRLWVVRNGVCVKEINREYKYSKVGDNIVVIDRSVFFSNGIQMDNVDIKWLRDEHYLICDEKRKIGIIDKNAEIIIPIIYEKIEIFDDEYYVASKYLDRTYKCVLIDKTGNEIISCDCNWIYEYNDEYYKIENNKKFGLINKNGKEIIDCIYDDIETFSNECYKIKKGNKYGIIDKTGKELILCDEIGSVESGGFAKATKNEKVGFIDESGNGFFTFLIDRNKTYMKDDRIWIRKNNDIFYAKNNKAIWRYANSNENGIFLVERFDKEIKKFVDINGNIFIDDLVVFNENSKFGIKDLNTGEVIVKAVFRVKPKIIKFIANNIIQINVNDIEMLVDNEGNILKVLQK